MTSQQPPHSAETAPACLGADPLAGISDRPETVRLRSATGKDRAARSGEESAFGSSPCGALLENPLTSRDRHRRPALTGYWPKVATGFPSRCSGRAPRHPHARPPMPACPRYGAAGGRGRGCPLSARCRFCSAGSGAARRCGNRASGWPGRIRRTKAAAPIASAARAVAWARAGLPVPRTVRSVAPIARTIAFVLAGCSWSPSWPRGRVPDRARCGVSFPPVAGRDHQSRLLASRAPSAMVSSFAQAIDGTVARMPTRVPNPQSLPARTRSRPTTLAYRSSRCATSSGCSM